MSYEISHAAKDNATTTATTNSNSTTTSTQGKYAKLAEDGNDEDCQLLLQETSLDEITSDRQRRNFRAASPPSTSLTTATEVGATSEVPATSEPTSLSSNQPESLSQISTTASSAKPVAAGNSGKKAKSSSHKSFDISLSSFIRFLSFRKSKKSKSSKAQQQADTSSISTEQSSVSRANKKYHSLPKRKASKSKADDAAASKDKAERASQSSKTDEGEKEKDKPNVFYRFVRTFSFLYKRNPSSSTSTSPTNSTTNFKRSQSVQNYRQTRSLPEIKYSNSTSQPSRVLNSPGSNSSSSRQTVISANSRQTATTDPANFKRDRAKSDSSQQIHRRTTQTSAPSSAAPSSVTLKSSGEPRPVPVQPKSNGHSSITETDGSTAHRAAADAGATLIKETSLAAPTTTTTTSGHRKELGAEVVALNSGSSNSAANRRRHLVSSGLETPAVCGIQNHGNTCFINSVVQCLSNTDILAEYFIFNHYREDLAAHRETTSNGGGKSFLNSGTRGELTEHVSILLKSLWSCMYSSDISLKFKKIVSKHGEQYNGYEQHDAQEFLLWLLDKCHEDLTVVQSPGKGGASLGGSNKNFLNFKKTNTTVAINNTKKVVKNGQKLYSETPITDEAAAIESLANYQTVNSNSIVYDLFQGQLRSMVVCRNCDHYSKTFDPYLCLSLPVPIRLTLTIFIHAIFVDNERDQSGLYGISIEAAATLRELRDKISRMLKIPEKRLLLLEIDKKAGMVEFTNDANMIQEIFEDFCTIFALETPVIPEHEGTVRTEMLIDTGEAMPVPKDSGNTMYEQMLTVVWLNRVGPVGQEGSLFGPPFTTVVSRESTFRKLQSTLLRTMSQYLIDAANVDCDEISRNINLRLRIVGGLPGKDYLSTEVDHPLFVPSVECALARTEDRRTYRGPHHLKLMVEWDYDIRRSIVVGDELLEAALDRSALYIDKSVERAKERSSLNNRTTLQDCLDIYFREESLTADNAWMCPMCNSRQQCVKQLSVWTLPNIFIIHLKRFRYMSNIRRIKINTMVEYPQNGLDMLDYVAQRKFNNNGGGSSNGYTNGSSDLANNLATQLTNGLAASNCGSKFSHKRKLTSSSVEETTFNLYGVVCHHGTMQGGHYTAYCKNPVDNCWYLFDDTKVIPVLEEAVVTADAYLLFYQKSSLQSCQPGAASTTGKVNPSTSSISSGYLSSVTCSSNFNLNHWAFQMPPFNYYGASNGGLVSNGGGGSSNGNKSSTLPNRRAMQQQQPNRGAVVAQHPQTNGYRTTNFSAKSSPKSYESAAVAAKHSGNGSNSVFYANHQNGGGVGGSNKKQHHEQQQQQQQQSSSSRSSATSSSHSSYNNTFPRIKSRQTSH